MNRVNVSARVSTKQRGFTLLEVLVAITIFSIMSVTALTGIKSIVDAQQKVEQVDALITNLQRSLFYLDQDFQYLVDRDVRDEYGSAQPSLQSSGGGDQLILMTVMNRKNALKQQRSSLSRVGYSLEDDTLIRKLYQQVDGASEEQANHRALINEIEEVQLRFLDKDNNWQLYWPPASAASTGVTFPKAIEINLFHKQLGKITRLFQIPHG